MLRKMPKVVPGLRRRALAVVLVALALAAASCTGNRPARSPKATVPKAAGTPAPAGPYAVPKVITKPYVQKVLDALEVVNAQATDLIVANKTLVPEAANRLRSINTSDEFSQQTAIWLTQLRNGLSNYRIPPGPVSDRVLTIGPSTSRCVFAMINRDYSGLEVHPPPAHNSYVVLRLSQPTDSSSGMNPTPWVISFLGYQSNGTPPPNPCVGTS